MRSGSAMGEQTRRDVSVFFSRAINWIVALGLALRLYHYGRNPSMWHDEAATSVNILKKSFAGLLHHLDYSATGPSMLLWIQKCIVLVLGDSTYTLRLVSVLASCVGLILLARLSRILLEPPAAFCAILLAACSDRMLWHASEARHYSSDFLFGAALLLLFVKTAGWPVAGRLVLFAVFSPFVILLSYPGIFLCAGLMLALAIEVRKENRLETWLGWFLLGLLMLVAFAFFYFVTIRAQRSSAMDAAWIKAFPDLHKPWKLPLWAIGATVSIFDYYVRPYAGGILIVPALIGLRRFWLENKRGLVVLIVVPMFFAMLLALVKSYPYTGARTMVYCLPGLSIAAGAGLLDAIRWLRNPSGLRLPAILKTRALSCVLMAVLLFPVGGTFVLSLYRAAVPWPRADTAGASDYVLAHRQSGDPVTSNHWEYEYYFRKLGSAYFPEMRYFQTPAANAPGRVWLVLTSGRPEDRLGIAQGIIDGNHWQTTDHREFKNTSVFLLFRPAQN